MAKASSWVAGIHAVDAVLRVSPERALTLCYVDLPNNPGLQQILQRASRLGIPLQILDKTALSKRCGYDQHQGVALEAKALPERSEQHLQPFLEQRLADSEPLLLVLDQVQDPHNFGACLRTADAAGVDAVIVARDNASPLTTVVQKVASGAAETVPVFRVTNLARTLDLLKGLGLWVVGTSDQARQSVYTQDVSGPMALVMGAEGKGMRRLTQQRCDLLVHLPMSGSVVSSLNVSVAAGICLYEINRQRQQRNDRNGKIK